jgi:glycosyltransferase involved in cell wall biosynthesis
VLAPAPAGGLESVVATLAIGQKARGHRVRVISVIGQGEKPGLHTRLETGGVEIEPIELPARSYARERGEYRRLFRAIHPDIVHTHGYRPDVLAGGIAGSLGIARVTTVHGFTGGDWKNRLYEFLQLRAFQRFESVVAVSRPLAGKLQRRGVSPQSLQVIPNGFDASSAPLARPEARAMLGLPSVGTVLGWVGRLSREKGLDVMLEALARLENQSLILSVLGTGAEREHLEEQAKNLGLSGRVQWHNLVPEAGRLYRAFDTFVMSSRTEGTPISLFEAMAADVPVVATAVGGVPDVLRDSEGWLVSPEDPTALAAAIDRVLSDPAEARRRAGRAAERVREVYGLGSWLDQYDRLYRSLLTRRTN